MNPILSYYINLITQFSGEAYYMIRKVDDKLWNQAIEMIENNKPQRVYEFVEMM